MHWNKISKLAAPPHSLTHSLTYSLLFALQIDVILVRSTNGFAAICDCFKEVRRRDDFSAVATYGEEDICSLLWFDSQLQNLWKLFELIRNALETYFRKQFRMPICAIATTIFILSHWDPLASTSTYRSHRVCSTNRNLIFPHFIWFLVYSLHKHTIAVPLSLSLSRFVSQSFHLYASRRSFRFI